MTCNTDSWPCRRQMSQSATIWGLAHPSVSEFLPNKDKRLQFRCATNEATAVATILCFPTWQACNNLYIQETHAHSLSCSTVSECAGLSWDSPIVTARKKLSIVGFQVQKQPVQRKSACLSRESKSRICSTLGQSDTVSGPAFAMSVPMNSGEWLSCRLGT